MIPALLLAAAITGTTVGAPVVTTIGQCPNRGAPGNVHTFTAAGDGTATAVMCGDFDTLIEIRRAGVAVACNDDQFAGECARRDNSVVSWPVLAGETFSVVATSYGGSGGPYALTIDGSVVVDPDPVIPSCSFPPSFDVDGTKTCARDRALIPCWCSEPFTWPPTPGAEWYEVQRTDPGGAKRMVGSTRYRGRFGPGIPQPGDEVLYPVEPVAHWLPENDSDQPRAGLEYVYQFRACSTRWSPNCGPWSTNVDDTKYVAAPLGCYDSKERECYPGDRIEQVSP